ncbi:MAG: hypothetical protein JWO21_1673, partial [Solirubrobacterales bacterium]|nr:hypothetical protein [Solirubrobacterales bacterium]
MGMTGDDAGLRGTIDAYNDAWN